MFLFNCKCESCIAKLLLTNKKQALVLKKKLYYRQFVLSSFFFFGLFSFLEITIRHLIGVT